MIDSRPAFVYVIECAGYAKVGVADDTRTRLAALNLTCPLEMTLLGRRRFGNRQDAFKAEKTAHIELSAQRHKGEWFAMGPRNPWTVLLELFPDANDEPEAPVPQFCMDEAVACIQRAVIA